ncbi:MULTISPECIES: hypothetical protein [Rhodopseudomonas]|uniref:hypothetical protein n=1 Tax=Rhodopseudomonas TaxID=1073 RepID=UPI0005C9081E|nr:MULTISPECIES: hypothetical protein [Rhodopseudomonas]MDF3813327.1 hypothetical protein [Rhodopseudomonas sp. BAL398]WOK17208.1 hypothetical protein RBJ75_24305 [Rhodopseudomonas sp. BAL398]
MLLGDLLRQFQDEAVATTTLLATNDFRRLGQVRHAAEHYGETVGEYVANAVRGFADRGNDEDWLAMMTALEHSSDAASTCLERMIDWSLLRDQAPTAQSSCSCGGHAGDDPTANSGTDWEGNR